jgi:RHS repeat-associated protein
MAAVLTEFGMVEGQDFTMESLQTPVEMGTLYPAFTSTMAKGNNSADSPESSPESTSLAFVCSDRQYDLYWYHPNYLGSVDLVTNKAGRVHQFFMYTAWGEAMYEYTAQSSSGSFDSPYRFNGKELDKETGYGYYGARYYQSKLSMWLSVDPLAHKYPNMSPYAFTGNNPVMLVDPDGNTIVPADEETANVVVDGAARVLLENNPFYYDSQVGQIKYKEFNREDFSPEQLELVDRYVSLIDSQTDIVNVSLVDVDQKIEETGKTLRQRGNSGITVPYNVTDSETGERVGTISNVYIAKNPVREGNSDMYGNPTYKPEPSWYPSLTGIHEIGGHAYLHAFFPNLQNKNEEVTNFEQRMRPLFHDKGRPVGGFAPKHK